jgi:hypothetical protein
LDDRTHALRHTVDRGAVPPAGQRGAVGLARWLLPALAILTFTELAWLLWCLIIPLPNANNVDVPLREPIRRGWILLKALPEVVPDTTFRQSLLGRALLELSHVENLPQRIPIVAAAGLIAAAAIGLGDLVVVGLRLAGRLRLGERLALDYGLGAALLGVVTMIAGRCGWLSPWSCRMALVAVASFGFLVARPWRFSRPQLSHQLTGWLPWLIIAPFLLAMFLGSMLPTIDFDVMEYHLQGPKEYYQAGRISFLPHNVYTSMPFGVEMLHLLGMEVLDDWWWGALAGQLLVATFAPAAAMLIAATAARGGSGPAGWVAAIVYLSTPWIYRLAVIAYVEGPLCFYHAALVWGLVRPGTDSSIPRVRLWGLLGLLSGGAMSCKYPGLVSAVIPFGILALAASWRSRSPAGLLAFSLGWAVVIGPWLGKNVIDTGDPVYPLGYRFFHGRDWDEAMQQKWQAVHGPRSIPIDSRRGVAREFANDLVDVAGRSDWQSPLYVALAPLALLRRGSRRLVLALWGYVAYLFLTWWFLTHRVDRFWLPLLPPLAVLAGLGGDWIRHLGWSIVRNLILSIVLLTNLTYISTDLAGLSEWTRDLTFLRDHIPRRLNAPLATMDATLPDDAKILLVGQAAVFYVNHRVVYNTVFNQETIETLASGKDSEGFRRALRDLHLTHIYVDWFEIQRHRKPGGYGFTDFVTPERFARWVQDGVLERETPVAEAQELYRIR